MAGPERVEAAERERRRLAEALHDGVVQDLFVARQELAEAREGAPESLDRLERALDRALAQVRHQILELHPPGLARHDLAAAIEALARQMERLGRFSCAVRVAPAAAGCHDDLVCALVRELLLNVAQHAGARHVSVSVEREDARLVVEVADDGRGIEPGRREAALAEGHIGLASAIERVEAVGGRLKVSSGPGSGTAVRVALPVLAASA